jgi:hypothetical protein
MPATFEIDKKQRLVRTYAWGEITFDDITQYQQALRTHPDFDATFDQFGELTDVVSVRISADEIRRLANQKLFSPISRRALVASTQFAYGMVRMFQAYDQLSTSPSNIKVFENASEAVTWLQTDK